MRRPVCSMALMAVLATSGCKGDSAAKDASDESISSPGCVSDAVCASSAKDCAAGERCNASFNPPRCQKLYCGALGTSCRAVSGSGDRASDLCASRQCLDGKCAAPGGVSFGCNLSGIVCVDYSLSSSDAAKSCTGGTLVAECTRAGALGGCKIAGTSDAGVQMVATQWFYTGDLMKLQGICANASGVWVSP